MGQLVEFPTSGGEGVLVEVGSGALDGLVTRGLGGAGVVERANQSFEEAVDRVQPAVQGVMARMRGLPDAPDEVQVEFGINLHAEAGAFIAAVGSTANFAVKLTWRKEAAPEPSDERPTS